MVEVNRIAESTPPDPSTTEPRPGTGAQVRTGPVQEVLRFGTPEHNRILARLQSRINLSQQHISQRYADWNQVDDHVRQYIDLSRRSVG